MVKDKKYIIKEPEILIIDEVTGRIAKYKDEIFKPQNEKINEIIKEVNKLGYTILICTLSIKKSEKLSKVLIKVDLDYKVLKAKYIQDEDENIGMLNPIIIGTNISGQGTNIKISE